MVIVFGVLLSNQVACSCSCDIGHISEALTWVRWRSSQT